MAVAADLAERLLTGDPRALARAISLVEDGDPAGREIVQAVFPRTGRAAVAGFTGPPGVGKSTLLAALVGHRRAAGRRAKGRSRASAEDARPSQARTQGRRRT